MSGSSSATGVEEISILLSTEDEVSSRRGLPGMIPADLAARSMAPERVLTEGEHKGFVTSDKYGQEQRLTKCYNKMLNNLVSRERKQHKKKNGRVKQRMSV